MSVAESVVAVLGPIQERYKDYIKNKDYLEKIYRLGAERAAYVANKTVSKVNRKVGFIQP